MYFSLDIPAQYIQNWGFLLAQGAVDNKGPTWCIWIAPEQHLLDYELGKEDTSRPGHVFKKFSIGRWLLVSWSSKVK